jgi:hypothetical protein
MGTFERVRKAIESGVHDVPVTHPKVVEGVARDLPLKPTAYALIYGKWPGDETEEELLAQLAGAPAPPISETPDPRNELIRELVIALQDRGVSLRHPALCRAKKMGYV